jgi:hypothetical protein
MRHFFITTLAITLFACLGMGCMEEPKPSLPQEKIVAILTDIHMAEAAGHRLFGEVKDSMLTIYYQQVYDLHGVQESEFLEDLDLLYQHPNQLEGIYEQVLERMNELQAKQN